MAQFIQLLDHAYTREDLLELEGQLLMTLDFRLNVATLHTFLPDLMEVLDVSATTRVWIEHLAYAAIADYECHLYLPSLLATTALVLGLSQRGHPIPWDILTTASGYSVVEIHPVLVCLQRVTLKRKVNIQQSQEIELARLFCPSEA